VQSVKVSFAINSNLLSNIVKILRKFCLHSANKLLNYDIKSNLFNEISHFSQHIGHGNTSALKSCTTSEEAEKTN